MRFVWDPPETSAYHAGNCRVSMEMRDARCEYKRLFSIIMLFRSFPGGFLVFGRGGGYVPPSTAQNYHPNRKMDPGFPIYTENKSAYGAWSCDGEQAARTSDMNDRKIRRLLSRSQLYRRSWYYRLAGGRNIVGYAPYLYEFCMRNVIS